MTHQLYPSINRDVLNFPIYGIREVFYFSDSLLTYPQRHKATVEAWKLTTCRISHFRFAARS